MTKRFSKRWVLPVVILAFVAFTGSSYALFSSTINFGGNSMTVGK
jgi:hypothetical protein